MKIIFFIEFVGKVSELETAFLNDDFPSSTNFFQSRPKIEASNVFQFIHGLPKGAALHLVSGRPQMTSQIFWYFGTY